MTLSQKKLDGLIAQLGMAQARHPVSTIQVAILKAQIRTLRAQIEAEHVPIDKPECYSVHTLVIDGSGEVAA